MLCLVLNDQHQFEKKKTNFVVRPQQFNSLL